MGIGLGKYIRANFACRIPTIALLVFLTVVLLFTLGCRNRETSQSVPTATPTAVPAKWLYDGYHADKQRNPTRLDARIERGELWRFQLIISNIEGSRIQEHFTRVMGGTDSYIECEFENENWVMRLNIGQTVKVYGRLHEAFKDRMIWPDSKAVKFRDCHY